MKRLISVFLFLLLGFFAFAQVDKPARCEVWQPKILKSNVLQEDVAIKVLSGNHGQTPAPSQKWFWVVFSDRENNVTYSGPGTNYGKYKALKFNQRVIIAKIKSDFALVYSEPKSEKYPLISSEAEIMGWIPMSNLLLWSNGLADKRGISYKAVICSNANEKDSGQELKLFKSPQGGNAKQLKTDMRFYFIYKRDGKKVLLGDSAALNESKSAGLTGWVNSDSFVPWNQRTCLEPTWAASDVKWLAQNGKMWQVYGEDMSLNGKAPTSLTGSAVARDTFTLDERLVLDSDGKKSTDAYKYEYQYRTMPPFWMRFPILEGSSNDLFHCSAFGTLNKRVSRLQISEDMQKAMAALAKQEIINIGILIDGTSSMQNYFPSVKEAIKEGCKYFGGMKVNVAVGIYRDVEDGQYIFESFPAAGGFLAPDNRNMMSFLDSGGEYGVKSKGKGETESVYFGIKSAVERFGFKPENSNLLLIVGDCGDNGRKGVKREELIDLLAKKKVSVMSFQVRNKKTEPFQLFNTQLTYIEKASQKTRYDIDAANRGNVSKKASVIAKPMADGTGWEIYNENRDSDMFDTNLYKYIHRRMAKENVEMATSELSLLMERSIGEWNKSLDVMHTAFEEFINGGDSYIDNEEGSGIITDAIVGVLGGDVERYKRLKSQNSLLSFRGWTPKTDPASGRSIYKVVVFFPEGELKQIILDFQPVYEAVLNNTKDRTPYYNALTSLASKLLAQDQVSAVSYRDLIATAFGLDASVLKKNKDTFKIEDVVNPNRVPQSKYDSLTESVKTSYEFLLKVASSKYPFRYMNPVTKMVYYWIPIEYLPL